MVCRFDEKTPGAHWVRRDVNILNKHTIPVIAINLLAAQFFWVVFSGGKNVLSQFVSFNCFGCVAGGGGGNGSVYKDEPEYSL